MTFSFIWKKEGVFPLLFLFLTSCCCSGPWVYREIERAYPAGTSALLFCIPNERHYGLELAFMKGDFGERGIVSVTNRTLPCLEGTLDFSPLWIYVDGECNSFAVHRYEGGQQLELTHEATSLLIDSLLTGKEVTIQSIGFSTQCPIGNFATEFAKWQNY